MIKVAIVEDEDQYTQEINGFIEQFMKETNHLIVTESFTSGEKFLFAYQPDIDVILLDIELPGMNGIETAEKIRRQDPNVVIIFITNMAKYAINGYKVKARAYILKPINYYSFAMELEDAISALAMNCQEAMLLNCDKGLVKILVRDITYIESEKHQILVHTNNGILRTRETMKNMEEKLQNCYFERCNVSFLINLAYVSGVVGEMVIVGGEQVPISRKKRKTFLAAVTGYIGGGRIEY